MGKARLPVRSVPRPLRRVTHTEKLLEKKQKEEALLGEDESDGASNTAQLRSVRITSEGDMIKKRTNPLAAQRH